MKGNILADRDGLLVYIRTSQHQPTFRGSLGLPAMCSVLEDLRASVPESMPPLESTSHLLPLSLQPQFVYYTHDSTARTGVQPDETHSVLRACRKKLRAWLATDIPIQYNKKAIRIVEDDAGVTVHFSDGSQSTGGILVGADGVNSAGQYEYHMLTSDQSPNVSSKPVRQHLTDANPRIVPMATISGEVTLHNDEVRRQLEIAHSAYTVDTKDGNNHPARLFVGLDVISPDKKSADYYWTVLWPDEGVTDASFSKPPASAEQLLETARQKMCLAPAELREILELTSPESIRRTPLIIRDMVLESLHATRVTLLGDAVHPMTPCKLSSIDSWNHSSANCNASSWGGWSTRDERCAEPCSIHRTTATLANIFPVL